MQRALRSYAATGAALTTATAILLSPVNPTMPDILRPSVHEISTELAAFVNPITTWTQVLSDAGANLSTLGKQLASDPAPILRQIIENDMSYATTLGTALQGAGAGLRNELDPTNPSGLIATVGNAAKQLFSGDIVDAANAIALLPVGVLFGVGVPFLPLLKIPGEIGQHIVNVVNTVLTQQLLGVAMVAISTVSTMVYAVTEPVQALLNAVRARDLVTAASVLINAPATALGILLNGDATSGHVGLLNFTIPNLLGFRDGIAKAIGPTAPAPAPTAAAAAAAAATRTPATAPKMVTVHLATPKPAASTETKKPSASTDSAKTGKNSTDDSTKAGAAQHNRKTGNTHPTGRSR